MRYRSLGRSGLKVSTISLGGWITHGNQIDQARTIELVRAAYDAGVNLFDTADVYARGAAESALGRAIAGLRRSDLVLATKVFGVMSDNVNDRGLSRKHVIESCHASLQRLGTDVIDLYQCHRYDPETPLEETVGAFLDLVRQGKIHYWGVSVWTPDEMRQACALAEQLGGPPPISNQPEYNWLRREIEAEVLPTCAQLGMGQIVWSPLAQGLLTGKYAGGRLPPGSRAADEQHGKFLRPALVPENLAAAAHLAQVAAAIGRPPAQVALAWVLRRPEIASAIVGATRLEQLRENLAASDFDLPAEVLAQLQAPFSVAGESAG